jgi:hypothetical protein
MRTFQGFIISRSLLRGLLRGQLRGHLLKQAGSGGLGL